MINYLTEHQISVLSLLEHDFLEEANTLMLPSTKTALLNRGYIMLTNKGYDITIEGRRALIITKDENKENVLKNT